MSLSNPTSENPNPSTRWMQWNGEKGNIKYFDKATETNIEVNLPITFIVLDQLATIKGWHDPSESAIYSNEVKDIRSERLLVKSFKGGQIAEGFYTEIKDKISANGGGFALNIYIAYYDADILKIGSLILKGAALGAWMEFNKINKKNLLTNAVSIESFDRGKKGSVSFTTPVFSLKKISEETLKNAVGLDIELQNYLKEYLTKKVSDKTDSKAPENIISEPTTETPWQNEIADDLPF